MTGGDAGGLGEDVRGERELHAVQSEQTASLALLGRLLAGAEYEARSVPLEIASNGQQFSTSVVQFTHTAPAIVSRFFPERGPESGDTHVVLASPNFELLATNSMGEYSNSTLSVSDGAIFLRTHESLWCIGRPAGGK